MPVNIRHIATPALLPLTVLGLCAAANRGGCDVTVTAEIRIAGATPARSSPVASGSDTHSNASDFITATISFKGKMARLDDTNGKVRIYDGVKGRIYTLNPTEKTYEAAALKDAWKLDDPVLRLPAGTDFESRLKLTKTDAAQTEAGRSTVRYECVGSLEPPTPEPSSNRPSSGSGGRGGGRRGRGGGGFPGGGFPGGGITVDQRPDTFPGDGASQGRTNPGGRNRPQYSVQVAGEIYLTDSALLPDGNRWVVGALVETIIPRSPLLKPCIDRLNHMKMIPLAGNLTFNIQKPGQNPDAISIETHVKSISEAPVDDAIFSVPTDYHMSSAR